MDFPLFKAEICSGKSQNTINPTTTLITLSFRRKPESSYNDTKDGNFGSMDIGGLLDAGSSPA
jgi:hypothetical protein